MYSHRKQKALKPNGDDSNCLVNLYSVGTQENQRKIHSDGALQNRHVALLLRSVPLLDLHQIEK